MMNRSFLIKFIVLLTAILFETQGFAQNSVYKLMKADTFGTNYRFRFVIENASFTSLQKISFFTTQNDVESKIKEISVSAVDSYFLLISDESPRLIQNYFECYFVITKSDYNNITEMRYELTIDGTTVSYPINKI